MVRPSNGFVAISNVLTLLLSLSIIGFSLYLQFFQSSVCQKVLVNPVFIIGLCIFFISLLGLVGSCCRIQFFLWLYLTLMFLLTLALLCGTVFIAIVTSKGVGKAISGKGYKEYRLEDYSNWFQNHVNEKEWASIRSCLADANVCQKLQGESKETADDFSKRDLSPIESGCCKPPTSCGFEFQNTTFWIAPKSGPAVPDSDCTTWKNDQSALCFNCDSCKAGFVANIKTNSLELIIISICVLVITIVVYIAGCYALRNNKYRPYPYSKAYV